MQKRNVVTCHLIVGNIFFYKEIEMYKNSKKLFDKIFSSIKI